jgi:hypothetical protein
MIKIHGTSTMGISMIKEMSTKNKPFQSSHDTNRRRKGQSKLSIHLRISIT